MDGQDTIPGRVKNCSLLYHIQTHSGAHPVSNARGTVGSILKVTSSTGIKNTCSYTLIPSYVFMNWCLSENYCYQYLTVFFYFCNAKIKFLLPMALWPMSWPWPPSFLPSITPISCCCTTLLHIEQFGGILLHNLVASFCTIWWHHSAFCPPLYSSAFQQAFFIQDFFPKFIFEFCC